MIKNGTGFLVNGHLLLFPVYHDGLVFKPPDNDLNDLADPAASDRVKCFKVLWREARGHRHHQSSAALIRQSAQPPGFFQVRGQRLLDKDVFARFQGASGHFKMQGAGRAHDHGIGLGV
jgi:hypothetical protein